jgi:hypothetical protein
MRRRIKLLLVALAVVVAGCAAGWWYASRDHGAAFLHRKGRLVHSERHAHITSSRTTVSDVLLRSDSGAVAQARMRVPHRAGPLTGLLLVVGLETGRKVIDLVEDRDDLVMLAVDYGWGDKQFDITTLPKFCRTMAELRALNADTVPRLLLGLDHLCSEPKVDPRHVMVIGVSYGSYFALPVAALDARVSRLILVQGGGELGAVLAANAGRWQAPLPPWAVAAVGETLFLPYQPERWIGRIAPRQVTFVASRTDPEFPVAAVEAVYALAGQPKQIIWHDTPHVAPDAAHIIAELSRVVLRQHLGLPSASTPPP